MVALPTLKDGQSLTRPLLWMGLSKAGKKARSQYSDCGKLHAAFPTSTGDTRTFLSLRDF